MARRRLTEEELEKIANKDWKQTPIFTSDPKVAYKAKNLTGPKTVEGKKRALQNLQVGRNGSEGSPTLKHGGYIRRILNEEEQEYYFSRREDYLRDYDINSSADEIVLHNALMEEVIQFRLHMRQAQKPSLDISRPLSESMKRLNDCLEALGALRKQRLKQDDKTTAINIATVAQQFFRELTSGSLQQQLKAQEEEERLYLEEKRKREQEEYAEYDAVVVDAEVNEENNNESES